MVTYHQRHQPHLRFAYLLGNTARVNTSVTELTDQLIASYARVGGINHLDGVNLPSKSAIALITTVLLKLLFPGFFDEKSLHSSEIKTETANLMDFVLGRL
jgi:serine O-acetyltransferase